MKTELEEVAEKLYPIRNDFMKHFQDIEQKAFINGYNLAQKRSYNEENMIEASKYGYNFHKTTQFPNQEFEDSCINNTKQWLTTFKK